MILGDVGGKLDFKGIKIKPLAGASFCVKSYGIFPKEIAGHLNTLFFFLVALT